MMPKVAGFSPDVFARRRDEACGALRNGILLLPSAPILFRSRDTEHRYRPDSELFYLTGSTQPGVLAVLTGLQGERRFILFVPERDPERELWSGPTEGPEETGERLSADVAYPVSELGERLPGLLDRASSIHFRLGSNAAVQRLVMEALARARVKGPRTGSGPRTVVDPGEVLDELRLRKDPEEIVHIRQAAALTAASFRETMTGVRPGMGEWEVEARLEAEFRKEGARGPAFPTIVGSGANACVLHYAANENLVEAGTLVLLDGGAEMGLYSGDITRTFPAAGSFSREQRAVYEVVEAARSAAVAVIRPGIPVGDVHATAVKTLTNGLVELGVLSGPLEVLLENKAYERFFPHQTSHWLGLDVHDVGDYAMDGRSRALEPGMVLTVEPGLYFSPSAEVPTDPFTGMGIRIEDDILVTEEGAENLTADLPVEISEVEGLVGVRA